MNGKDALVASNLAINRLSSLASTLASIDPIRLAQIAARLLRCASSRITEVPTLDPIFARASDLYQLPRNPGTFADVVMAESVPLIVPDAQKDTRFSGFLEVVGFPRVRFVVGLPLFGTSGDLVGALTMFDVFAQDDPAPSDLADAVEIASVIGALVEHRRDNATSVLH